MKSRRVCPYERMDELAGERVNGYQRMDTERRMDGRTDGRTDERTDERSGERTDEQMVGRTDRRTDGWTDGCTDGWTDARTEGRSDTWSGGRTDGRIKSFYFIYLKATIFITDSTRRLKFKFKGLQVVLD